MTTIEDIVAKSGISRSTVFRFLNGSKVRENSKVKIIAAMEELDYKIHEIDKHKNFTIEISVSQNYDEFQGFSQVIEGIMEYAQKAKISVQLVKRVGKQIDLDYEKWDKKNTKKGIIILGKDRDDELKEAKILIHKNIPHILINRHFMQKDISFVSVDLEKGAYDMVKYLIENGHRKILTIGNPKKFLVDEKKLAGYKKALKHYGMDIDPKYYHEMNSKEEWVQVIKKALDSSNLPDAYFGLCDGHCVKFMNIARSLGYDIPKDVSVVGMDDVDSAKYAYPPLTTIKVPFKQMGSVAIKQMIHILKGEYESTKIFLPYRMIQRYSVKNRT